MCGFAIRAFQTKKHLSLILFFITPLRKVTATKYYGYWIYRNYGGINDAIQGGIIDAAVGAL